MLIQKHLNKKVCLIQKAEDLKNKNLLINKSFTLKNVGQMASIKS